MANVVLLFETNMDTMIASKALKSAGVTAKMLPVAPGAKSGANLCLSVEDAAEKSARATLEAANVALQGVAR